METITMRRLILEVLDYAKSEKKLMFFGGGPEDNFIYAQFKSNTILYLGVGGSDDGTLAVPKIAEVIGIDELRIMDKDEELFCFILKVWKECLTKYLLDVKNAGNAKLLPNEAKDHLISLL
jgi:hypothetical protein